MLHIVRTSMRKSTPWILPMLRTVLFVGGGWIFIILTNQTLADASKWWPVMCIGYNLITILVLLLICKKEHISYRSLIGDSTQKNSLWGTVLFTLIMLGVGVGGMLGFSVLFYGGLPEFLILPIPVWLSVLTVLLLPVTIVFSELPLYFGYSFNRIRQATNRPKLAIAYVVFFYALQHSFIPLLLDVRFILFRFLSFLPLMVFLGIMYNRKKNMRQMMIGHAMLDFSTGLQVFLISIL